MLHGCYSFIDATKIRPMSAQKIPDLSQRKGIWHIDKKINGERLYESTGTSEQEESERYLIYRLEQIRQQKVYGAMKVRA